jgi:hypothetical protein
MKKTLSTAEAAQNLLEDINANWTRAGAFALVEYLEEYEDSTGEVIEFDCVVIRCEYSQHESLQEWLTDYYGEELAEAMASAGIDLSGDEDEDEIDNLIRSHIHYHGQLIEFSGGIIVSAF